MLFESVFRAIFCVLEAEWHRFLKFHLMRNTLQKIEIDREAQEAQAQAEEAEKQAEKTVPKADGAEAQTGEAETGGDRQTGFHRKKKTDVQYLSTSSIICHR